MCHICQICDSEIRMQHKIIVGKTCCARFFGMVFCNFLFPNTFSSLSFSFTQQGALLLTGLKREEKGRGVFSSHYVARTTVLLQRKTERGNVHFPRTENNIISPKLVLFSVPILRTRPPPPLPSCARWQCPAGTSSPPGSRGPSSRREGSGGQCSCQQTGR